MISRRTKRFAVDLDGVMYDLLGGLISHLRTKWKYDLKREDVKQYNLAGLTGLREIDEDIIRQLHTPRFYESLEPCPGAQEAVRMLADAGEVYVLTARPDGCSPTSFVKVQRDFPTMVKDVITTPNKGRAAKDRRIKYAIDDAPHHAHQYVNARIKTWLIMTPYTNPSDLPRGRFLQKATSLLAAAQDILKNSKITEEVA